MPPDPLSLCVDTRVPPQPIPKLTYYVCDMTHFTLVPPEPILCVNTHNQRYTCPKISRICQDTARTLLAGRGTWHITRARAVLEYAHVKTAYHTHECVIAHIWMRHSTHMNASCHTYDCVMSYIWHISFGMGSSGTGVPFHVHGPGFSEVLWGQKR